MKVQKIETRRMFDLEKKLKLYNVHRSVLRQILVEWGFLPPDARELAKHDFPIDVEGRLAVPYQVITSFELTDTEAIPIGHDYFFEKVGDDKLYCSTDVTDSFLQECIPLATLPPRLARDSDTAILTSGALNLLAAYTMTEKSYTVAVPHIFFATKSSHLLARYLKNKEIKKVVLAFPKSQRQQQQQLASILRKKGFKVEILPYEGKTPFEHYQISISKMMEQAMEAHDAIVPDNGV